MKALQKSISPFPRIRQLASMQWVKITGENAALFLPDCVSIVETESDLVLPFMLADRSEVERIIFPLSHRSLLVGTHSDAKRPTLKIGAVNDAFVGCAWDFVVTNLDAVYAPDTADKIRSHAYRAIERLTSEIGKV